jgi:hypothetical protein
MNSALPVSARRNPLATIPGVFAQGGLLVLLAVGCAQPATTPETAANAAPSAPPAASSPSGTATSVSAAGITFDLPEGWVQQPPDSPMRLGQAVIPGAAGDGLLTIFFFGPGGGGSAAMNIDRWVAQMVGDPGVEPTLDQAQNGEFQVSYVEHTGTLKASQMGTFPSTDQPGYALLGAVVEGAGGPWFFKAVAPQETLSAQRDAFRAMISSIRQAG